MSMLILSVLDKNDVRIIFADDLAGNVRESDDLLIFENPLLEALDFMKKSKCEYITATAGITTGIDGQPEVRAEAGTFQVDREIFAIRMQAFHKLQFVSGGWRENGAPISADLVKKRIRAATLPFKIDTRTQNSLYFDLRTFCTSTSTAQPLNIVTAQTLNDRIFDRPPAIVKGLLYAGVTLLSAPPKTGKSFLALDLACAVATGEPFWTHPTKQGNVLYLDLEGREYRTQQRLPIVKRHSCPADLAFVYEDVQPVDRGLIEQLRAWIDGTQQPRLVIIDTLAHIKGKVARGEDAYTADTRFMKPLHDLAMEKGIAILAITHTRKSGQYAPDDPFENTIGSQAQFGNADAGWIITGKRSSETKTFIASGRDFEDTEFEIERVKGRWQYNGTVEELTAAREEEAYRQNMLADFIKCEVRAGGGGFKATANELYNLAAQRTGQYLAEDAIRLSKAIRELAPLLLRYDGILTNSPERSTKSKRYFTFTQQERLETTT